MLAGDLQSFPNNRYRALLIRGGFVDSAEVLVLASAPLSKRLKVSVQESADIIQAVAKWREPISQTVADLILGEEEVLSTACFGLDDCLSGGFRCGVVNEVVGEASAGKSTLCLQLCISVQMSISQGGLHGGVAYISSEGSFPSARLLQMIKHRHVRDVDGQVVSSCPASLDNVYLANVSTFEALLHCLQVFVPALVAQTQSSLYPLRLLIIDSLAATVRSEYTSDSNGLMQRGKDLTIFGATLKSLASRLNLAVICVNQVSDTVNQGLSRPVQLLTDDSSSQPGQSFVQPILIPYDSQVPFFSAPRGHTSKHAALGLSWANSVAVRLFLRRTGKRRHVADADGTSQPVRAAHVVFSPFGPPKQVEYLVDESGFSTLSDAAQETLWPARLISLDTSHRPNTVDPPRSQEATEDEQLWLEFGDLDNSMLPDDVDPVQANNEAS